MAPCMDNWLDLADPAQVHAFGAVLRKLTDPANFELYRYMPVVRDMTQGERTLLWAFLDSPLDSGEREGPPLPVGRAGRGVGTAARYSGAQPAGAQLKLSSRDGRTHAIPLSGKLL